MEHLFFADYEYFLSIRQLVEGIFNLRFRLIFLGGRGWILKFVSI
jgi:hypothetical protein